MTFQRWKFLIAAGTTAFCALFNMSYQAAIINPTERLFLQFINDTNVQRYGEPMSETARSALWGWIVCLMSVGGLIGSVMTPFLAEKLGRKMSFMMLSNILAIGSSLLMSFCLMARSYEMLAVGRFINGISEGVATTILPLYLSECSPINYRGLMGSLQNLFVNVQTVLSFVVALPSVWGNLTYLPVLVGFGIIPSVIQMISSYFLPESPKYLYIKQRNVVAAEKSLKFWAADHDLTSADMKVIFKEFDQDAESLAQEVGFFQAIKVPYFRRVFIVASVLLACQNLTAVGPVFSYSTDMFLKLGFPQDMADLFTNLLAVVNTIGALAMAPFVERYPRRLIFFSGYILLVIALLGYSLLGVAFEMTGLPWTAYIALAFLFAYAMSYNMGAGLLIWIIPAEMSPQAIRSSVVAVSSSVGWVVGLVVTFVYPPLADLIGSWSYFVYLVPLVLLLIYLYKAMPETGGKTIAEIVKENSEEKKANDESEVRSSSGDSACWPDGEASPDSVSTNRSGADIPNVRGDVYVIGRNLSIDKF